MDLIRIGIKKTISVNEVLAIEACDNYSFIHTKTEKFITSKTLAYYERQDIGFWRIHKHALINPGYILKLDKNTMVLEAESPSQRIEFKVSKLKKGQTKRALTAWINHAIRNSINVSPTQNASFWQQAA